MEKTSLKQINSIFPFDANYVKVGKGKKNVKWNLMDSNGKLVSDTWFSSIARNTDGSIVTTIAKRKELAAATFFNVDSFVRNVDVVKLVPMSCISLVDTGSLVSIKDPKYIAKATVYGTTVYIDKAGDLWLADGTKLRLLLNTVDSERLFAAVRRFNKKLHYDTGILKDDEKNTFESLREKKQEAWAFYFATDKLAFNTYYERPKLCQETRGKWTDDLIFRIRYGEIPQSVIDALFARLGKIEKKEPLNYTNHGVWLYTWHLKKEDLNKLIDALDSI